MISSASLLDILKYIEKNLVMPLKAKDIAAYFGYSQYHFSKLFKDSMGTSIMKYITARRIIKASDEIREGSKIIDAALKYQFETHRGFTKAFQQQFGYSPVLLKTVQLQLFNLKEGTVPMIEKHETKEVLFARLLYTMDYNKIPYNKSRIEIAYNFSIHFYNGKKRYSGDDYVTHLISTAIILAEIEAQEEAILAGLFCDIYKKCSVDTDELLDKLPVNTVQILKELSTDKNDISDEALIVKLSEWLHNMRTLEYMSSSQWKSKAKETAERIIPLCERLQLLRIKEELETIMLKYENL